MVQVSWSRRRQGPLLLGMVLALALQACGSAPPARPDRYYSLEPPLPAPLGGTPVPVVLLVNNLGARGFLGGRAIVFRTSDQPLVVQRYDSLLWAEPPTRALAAALVGAIRSAGLVEVVAVAADQARFDLMLGGEVTRFEHLPMERPPRVAGAINLVLVRAPDRAALASRQYAAEEPVVGDTPDAMAQAFNRLTGRLMAQVVGDLRGLKPRLARAP